MRDLSGELFTFRIVGVTCVSACVLVRVDGDLNVSIGVLLLWCIRRFLRKTTCHVIFGGAMFLGWDVGGETNGRILDGRLGDLILVGAEVSVLLRTLRRLLGLVNYLATLGRFLSAVGGFLDGIAGLLDPVFPVRAIAGLFCRSNVGTFLRLTGLSFRFLYGLFLQGLFAIFCYFPVFVVSAGQATVAR